MSLHITLSASSRSSENSLYCKLETICHDEALGFVLHSTGKHKALWLLHVLLSSTLGTLYWACWEHFLFVFGLQWLMRCFNVHVPACYCSATLVFLFLPLKSICYCCWRIDSFNFLLLTCLSLRPRDVVFITVALFQGKCPSLEISVWGLVCIEQTRMAVCLSWRKRGPIYPEQLAGMEFNSFGLPGCAAEVAGVAISDSNSCSKVLESRLKPF